MIPLLAIAAYSGTGKTTLLTQLIPRLKSRGIRTGIIKHTHHAMDIDKPGKDSHTLRKAGTDQIIVASNKRWALITETPESTSVDLNAMARRMDHTRLDLILAEGFKQETVPKILLWRRLPGRPVVPSLDPDVIAVASDIPLAVAIPVLALNQPDQIADFICHWRENLLSG